MKKLEHLQCRQYYYNNWLLNTTDYWWKEKLKVSVTVIKQRLEYHIYVNFSVQNLLYLTCTTHGMPNFFLVCGSVSVQLDMSPRKACQSIKKFHLFSFLIFWHKYHNTFTVKIFENQNFSKSWKSHIPVVVNMIGKNDSVSTPKKQHLKNFSSTSK